MQGTVGMSCDKIGKRKVSVYPGKIKKNDMFLDKNIIKIYKNVYNYIGIVYFCAFFDIIQS